jgi:hypothetical protein
MVLVDPDRSQLFSVGPPTLLVALPLRVYDFQFYEHTGTVFFLFSRASQFLLRILFYSHEYSTSDLNIYYGEVFLDICVFLI